LNLAIRVIIIEISAKNLSIHNHVICLKRNWYTAKYDSSLVPETGSIHIVSNSSRFKDLRYSLDGTKTFIKFRGEVPTCIQNLETKSETLTSEEINDILHTEEWNF
jgi:hypothetical protein